MVRSTIATFFGRVYGLNYWVRPGRSSDEPFFVSTNDITMTLDPNERVRVRECYRAWCCKV
jgi:hypothetical protein